MQVEKLSKCLLWALLHFPQQVSVASQAVQETLQRPLIALEGIIDAVVLRTNQLGVLELDVVQVISSVARTTVVWEMSCA